MGQYHILVNLDKKEYVSPHGLGLGLKQVEHLSTNAFHQVASLSDALYFLVMSSPESGGGDFPNTPISGLWVGDRVVVLGDYTVDGVIPGYENVDKIWEEIDENHPDYCWTNITEDVAEALGDVFGFRVVGDGWKTREAATPVYR